MSVTVAVVGAGRIACQYDVPGASVILTHAHAITHDARTKLLGFYDPNTAAARAAADRWGGQSFDSLSELLSSSPAVIIVCSPDHAHYSCLVGILQRPSRLVICEKPLTLSHSESKAILKQYSDRGIGLWVNYQRRLDPTVVELAARYQRGELGEFLTGALLYAKGIKHNGSHGIDLLRTILGEPSFLSVHGKHYDFCPNDPSVAGMLEFGDRWVALLPGDERAFSIFELDLLFERGRYRFHHSGMKLTIQAPVEDPVFPGYLELLDEVTFETGFVGSLSQLLSDSVDWLAGHATAPKCDAGSVLQTQWISEQLADLPVHSRKAIQS